MAKTQALDPNAITDGKLGLLKNTINPTFSVKISAGHTQTKDFPVK